MLFNEKKKDANVSTHGTIIKQNEKPNCRGGGGSLNITIM